MAVDADVVTVSADAARYAESFGGGSTSELEKELRRLVRLWQDNADRATFSEEMRPPWWPPNQHVSGIPSISGPVQIPPFRGKSKTIKWTKDVMLALVALAVDSFREQRELDLTHTEVAPHSSPSPPQSPSPSPPISPTQVSQSPSPPTSPCAPASPTLGQIVRRPSLATPVATPGSPSHPAMRRAKLACAELDAELQRRIAAWDAKVDAAVSALRNVHAVEIMKLPKKVKKMPLATFLESFQGNTELFYLAAIREQVQKTLADEDTGKENRPAPQTARRLRAKQVAVEEASQAPKNTRKRAAAQRATKKIAEQSHAATPKNQPRKIRQQQPPLIRQMRPGESILSKNGSPLCVAVEKPASNIQQTSKAESFAESSTSKITFQLANGKPMCYSIGPDDRDIAKEVLETLQSHFKELEVQMHNFSPSV